MPLLFKVFHKTLLLYKNVFSILAMQLSCPVLTMTISVTTVVAVGHRSGLTFGCYRGVRWLFEMLFKHRLPLILMASGSGQLLHHSVAEKTLSCEWSSKA